ncbi:DUF1292 domain-containing protein [Oceanirhabdus sp. W0125-5]|uniref:DUF1292 domain-containing protein n=1 Tax=Oceanirhabdus sp. W0125-5 TaxID=2999116 RepID=UPI0022F3012E|nr:DUF1292 domain-containing protein [Oceanirhabdus sp. W0125-5]WBW99609.1 DUF1292 domain-containing protein [Oceanirhabdus sp. W0125-5]
MSEEIKYVTLLDEEGNEVEFEVVTKLDIEEVEYFIVIPKDEDVEEAIALKLVYDEDGEELFVPVEEEHELMMVSEAYEILFEEEEEEEEE